jgi:hypothetical protein
LENGADGILLDPEAEWTKGDRGELAARADRLVQAVRRACPDRFVGYAPMDYLTYHPAFPWRQFSALDACMPQVYAWEHDDRGHRHHLAAVDAIWSEWEHANCIRTPRLPIGCTYRPKTRGGRLLVPIGEETIAADVADFLDLTSGQTCSLYSLEAASPMVLELLRARQRARRALDWSPQTSAATVLPDLVPEVPHD